MFMFARKKSAKKRHVVMAIKTTNFHQYNPEEGDKLTQIACVEMIDGELTGNDFTAYVKLTDADMFEAAKKLYREKLDRPAADELITNMASAQDFAKTQAELLAYLARDADTKIIVHYKKYVLDFLRKTMDATGVEALEKLPMENMISKASKMAKAGLYQGGRYASEVKTGKEKVADTRSFYKFDMICNEYGVSTRLRTDFSAKQDAEMLAKAERARLVKKQQHVAKSEDAVKSTAVRKPQI